MTGRGPLWALDGATVELRGEGHYVAPGVTLIGRAGADAALLGFAYALEQATKLRVAPPEPTTA